MGNKNRILAISTTILLMLHSVLIFMVSTLPVYALSVSGIQTTIASIIMSLLLQTGTAPVNQSYIDMINTSYGVESSIGTIEDMISNGLLTETGSGLVDTGLSSAIESQTAYTELGLAEIFTTSADDVADGVLTGSGGVNLANTAINCGTAGTIGAFAGAASIGVGIGVLANHVREYIGSVVKYGLPLSGDTISTILNNIPTGYDRCYFNQVKNGNEIYSNFAFVKNDVAGTYYTNARGYNNFYVYNNTYDSMNFQKDFYINKTGPSTQIITFSSFNDTQVNGSNLELIANNFKKFNDRTEINNYYNDLRNGLVELDPVYAPDIIGENGNLKNDQIGSVVPSGYDMRPVDMDDYINFAEGARDNTEEGNINKPIQGEDFDNLIDNLLVEPSIIPDQGLDIPTIPDRPAIPEQPDQPPKDPISDQEQEAINAGLVNTELANVFPFCIPFDIYAMFGNLKAGREAPVLVYEFPDQFGWGAIEIDLSPYEEAAKILRTMELLLFIIGLAINTRPLIGAL